MEPGAVTNIGKNVLFVQKWRLAYPRRTFTPHLGKRDGIAIHPDRHVMAADASEGTTAFWHTCAGVVRTPATKPWGTLARTGIDMQK